VAQVHHYPQDEPVVYQITVRGSLDPAWSGWFDGCTIDCRPSGETTITGVVVDQPALHGLLKRVRDLGLTLLLVRRLDAP
jgi:hypothetical protein